MRCLGGINSTALLSHIQQHPLAQKMGLKMAIISKDSVYVCPQIYFACIHEHIKDQRLMSDAVPAQIEQWSKIETGIEVTKVNGDANSLEMSNGKTFNYKSLVLAPGFDHSMEPIEGLTELADGDEANHVFAHILDKKERVSQNYYSGWQNLNGDTICYSPKFPYKGEGTDFYAAYYEHFQRLDTLNGRAAANARIQYWTPNKEIYKFGYASEAALDECHKRGIEVMFGWEMMKVQKLDNGQKIATFKNVDSGEVIEKDFHQANINPPSKTHQWIKDSDLADSEGLLDVNKYTLQHKKYDNIFGFGDAVGFETTRTQGAAAAQNPIVKNNVLQFLQGNEINGVYDGYTFMPFLLGNRYASSFQHKHDFEPAAKNHMIPNYGIFSRVYFDWMMNSQKGMDNSYSGFNKNHGPPHGHWPASYDELEHNDYLKSKNIDPADLVNPKYAARLAAKEAEPSV